MDVKIIFLSITLFYLLLTSTLFAAESINITGNEKQTFNGILGDRDRFTFQVNAGETISISVKQINADVKLRLLNTRNNHTQEIYQLSTSADTWLNELLYITAEDCVNCILQVLPQELIDQSGKYKLTFERLDSIEPSEKAIMQLATQAGIAWQKANNDTSRSKDHWQAALTHYQAAIEQSESEQLIPQHIRNLYHASQIEHLLGDYDQQQKRLLHLLSHDQNPNSALVLRAKYELATTFRMTHQIELARGYLDETQIMAKEQSDTLMQAKILVAQGRLAYETSQYQESLLYNKQAIKIYLQVGEWRGVFNCKLNIGVSLVQQGDKEQAIQEYQQVLSLAYAVAAKKYAVDAHIKLATQYRFSGYFERANNHINQALKESKNFSHSVLDGRAKQEKARILMVLGQFELASDVFEQAYQAYQKQGATTEMINIDYFSSIIHSQLGNYPLAMVYASKVLEHDKKLGINYDIGTAYHRMAEISLGLKIYPEAMRLQELALDYLADSENTKLKAKVFAQSAEIYYQNQQPTKGKYYFQLSRKAHNTSYDVLGSLDTEYRIAKMLQLSGESLQAIQTLQPMIKKISNLQQRLSRGDQRRAYLALQQKLASLYLQVLSERGESAEKMLSIAEQFRSQTLQDKKQQLKAETVPNQDYLIARRSLQEQMQNQVIHYHSLSDPEQRLQIAKQTRSISSQLHQLEAGRHRIADVKTTHSTIVTSPIKIQQIQQNLTTESLILYFDTGPEQSHLWVLDKSSLSHVILPDEGNLSDMVNNTITSFSFGKNNKSRKQKISQQQAISRLSKALFGNAAIQWQQYKQLIVIADGPLHYLPFSTLIIGEESSSLIDSVAISYLPTLRNYGVLNQLNMKMKMNTDDKILLIADPSIKRDRIHKTFEYTQTRSGLVASELPFTAYEAQIIENILKGRVTSLKRDAASKTKLFAQPLNEFDIVHFATHGVSYSHTPSLAGLVLSNTLSSNNLLLAPEIRNLDLKAKMVVLSGCETAKGKLINGEGLMGLSRAFLEAGAKSVVASLWPVQDKATAELMKHFYYALFEQGLAVNEALRQAKLAVRDFRKKNGHQPWREPYFWAGFVLQG